MNGTAAASSAAAVPSSVGSAAGVPAIAVALRLWAGLRLDPASAQLLLEGGRVPLGERLERPLVAPLLPEGERQA